MASEGIQYKTHVVIESFMFRSFMIAQKKFVCFATFWGV